MHVANFGLQFFTLQKVRNQKQSFNNNLLDVEYVGIQYFSKSNNNNNNNNDNDNNIIIIITVSITKCLNMIGCYQPVFMA